MSNSTINSSYSFFAYNYVISCSEKFIADTTYWAAKTFVNELAGISSYLLSTAADRIIENSGARDFHERFIAPFGPPTSQFISSVQDVATTIIAPNLPKLNKECAIEPFMASDLIGPSLLLMLSSRAFAKNAYAASLQAYYLVSGQRRVVNSYKLPSSECVTSECNFTAVQITNHTTFSLLNNIVYSSVLAGASYFIGDYTRQGIINALVQAGNSENNSAIVVNILTIGYVALPIIISYTKSISDCMKPKTMISHEVNGLSYAYQDERN